MQGIYEIINLTNGKSYVGSSSDIKRRWIRHVRTVRDGQHVNPYLQNAWNKYGEESFSFCVIERATDNTYLEEREQHWLDRAFEVGDTYNMSRTSRGRGHPQSEETRQKISATIKKYEFTAEHKRNISRSLVGHEVSEETVRSIVEANSRPYPAFVHVRTGEIIPAGCNLEKLCKERGLHASHMREVKDGRSRIHRGWILADTVPFWFKQPFLPGLGLEIGIQ